MIAENRTTLEVVPAAIATVGNNTHVTSESGDLALTIDRREYTIVGDDVYITRDTEAPQWLVTLVESLVSLRLDDAFSSVSDLLGALDDAIDAMEIAKNAYTMSVINYSDLEQIVNGKLETLNSTLRGADASIIDILVTKVTADQASTIAAQSLRASLLGGDVKAALDTIRTAVATETSSRALAIDAVRTELYDVADSVGLQADAIETLESSVSLVDGPIKNALIGIQSSVTALESQIDGVVATLVGVYEALDPNTGALVLWQDPPTNTVKTLYKEWLDADTLDLHIGDTYVLIENLDGVDTYVKSWKFQKGSTGSSNTDADGYGWFPITDSTAIAALAKAIEAKDLADGKRRVFTATPYPPYDVGDLWSQGLSGDIMRCKTAKDSGGVYRLIDWEKASKYTDDTALTAFVTGPFTSNLADVYSQLDQKTTAYFDINAPHDEIVSDTLVAEYDGYVNDVWYDGGGTNNTYIYTRTKNNVPAEDFSEISLEVTSVNDLGSLLTAITLYEDNGEVADVYDNKYYYKWVATPIPVSVFDKIDGKKTIYVNQPYNYAINDLWIPQVTTGSFVAGEVYVSQTQNDTYSAADWLVATKYTEDLELFVLATEAKIDNTVVIYSQATAPTFATDAARNAAHGDIWIDTDAAVVDKYWRYNSVINTWVSAPDLVTVFADLALKGNVTYRSITSGVGSTSANPITTVFPSDFFGTAVGTKKGDTLLVTYWYKKGTAAAKSVTDMYLWDGNSWGVAGVSAAANSKWAIDQKIEIAGLGATVSGMTAIVTGLEGTVDDNHAEIQSKFAYDSALTIGSTTYNTGFGLATSVNRPTAGIPVGSSEFWIKADKFKLTSSTGISSSYAPFTVDSATRSITFNGKVSFSNVVGVPASSTTYMHAAPAPTSPIKGDIWYNSNANFQPYRYSGSSWVAVAFNPATYINSGTTTINGAKIATGSLTALQIAGNSITGDKLKAGTVTADKIGTYSLTAANAAIANGMFTTAMVGANQITFNVGVYRTSTLTSTLAGTDILDAVINCSGAPVNVHASFFCSMAGDWAAPKNTFNEWYAKIDRVPVDASGNVIGTRTTIYSGWIGAYKIYNTNSAGFGLGSVSFNYRHSPGAGYSRYIVNVYTSQGTHGLTVRSRSIILSELKR